MNFDINNIIITFLEYKNLPGGFADFRETRSDSGSLPDNPGGLATLIVSEFGAFLMKYFVCIVTIYTVVFSDYILDYSKDLNKRPPPLINF